MREEAKQEIQRVEKERKRKTREVRSLKRERKGQTEIRIGREDEVAGEGNEREAEWKVGGGDGRAVDKRV
jgi:hypothetical protein